MAGDERFTTTVRQFYNSNGLIVCFDLTNEKSFYKVEIIIKEFIKRNLLENCLNLENLNAKLTERQDLAISIVGLKCEMYYCNDYNNNNLLDKQINLLLNKMVPNEVKYKDLFIQYFEVSSKEEINVNAPIYL